MSHAAHRLPYLAMPVFCVLNAPSVGLADFPQRHIMTLPAVPGAEVWRLNVLMVGYRRCQWIKMSAERRHPPRYTCYSQRTYSTSNAKRIAVNSLEPELWRQEQWRRRSVEIHGSQDQSGQAIKVFQAPRKLSFDTCLSSLKM